MSSFFPISLNTQSGQDQFSRAVSPIGHKAALPAPVSGLSNITSVIGPIQGSDMDVDMDADMNDHTMSISSSTTPPVNIVDFAYHNLGG